MIDILALQKLIENDRPTRIIVGDHDAFFANLNMPTSQNPTEVWGVPLKVKHVPGLLPHVPILVFEAKNAAPVIRIPVLQLQDGKFPEIVATACNEDSLPQVLECACRTLPFLKGTVLE